MCKKEIDGEAVVHHIHHKDDNKGFSREVSINGAVYSISLSGDYINENIDYLTDKAMKILKQLREEGNR